MNRYEVQFLKLAKEAGEQPDGFEYGGTIWIHEAKPCFVCKKDTHLVDISYEGYLCSPECEWDMLADLYEYPCSLAELGY